MTVSVNELNSIDDIILALAKIASGESTESDYKKVVICTLSGSSALAYRKVELESESMGANKNMGNPDNPKSFEELVVMCGLAETIKRIATLQVMIQDLKNKLKGE